MNFVVIFLLLYIFILITYVSILIFMLRRFKIKFGYLCECSGLGEKKNDMHRVYNIGYLIWGLFSLGFSYILVQHLQKDIYSAVAQILLYVASISLCFIALFPRDTHFKIHKIFSISLFIGIIGYMFALVVPFTHTRFINPNLIALNMWVAITLGFYSYLKIYNYTKYGLHNDKERYESKYEWIPFLSGFLWLLLVSVSLLKELFRVL